MNQAQLEQLFYDLPLGSIHYFPSLPSTNGWALQEVERLPHASLVITDHQTQGRGRLDRSWHSQSGASLTFSLVIKEGLRDDSPIWLTAPAAGLAICRALTGLFGQPVAVKWPNDVLINGCKTAGILTEASWKDGVCQGVVAGMGINLKAGAIPPADQQMYPATCIECEWDVAAEPVAVLHAVVKEFLHGLAQLGSRQFFSEWESRLAFLGQQIKVLLPQGGSLQGVFSGLGADGSLRIRLDNGTTEEIQVADVVHLRPNSGSV